MRVPFLSANNAGEQPFSFIPRKVTVKQKLIFNELNHCSPSLCRCRMCRMMSSCSQSCIVVRAIFHPSHIYIYTYICMYIYTCIFVTVIKDKRSWNWEAMGHKRNWKGERGRDGIKSSHLWNYQKYKNVCNRFSSKIHDTLTLRHLAGFPVLSIISLWLTWIEVQLDSCWLLPTYECYSILRYITVAHRHPSWVGLLVDPFP